MMVRKDAVEFVAIVFAWFLLNIAIGSSVKWIFLSKSICTGSGPAECRAFKFPLAITVLHMLFSWGMCFVQITCLSRRKLPVLGFREQLKKIVPLAACFSASVAMGNTSLKYIYPSFNQMLGAMSPLITVGLAVLMQGKRFDSRTWFSMPIICGGLFLCSIKELNFDGQGAFYATGATVLRAMKSIIQGKLLQTERLDSVALLFYMAPWAAGMLLLVSLACEGLEPELLLLHGLRGSTRSAADADAGEQGAVVTGGPGVLVLLLLSGLIACLLNVANFLVTAYSSPLTLQVLGNVKSCLSIAVSVAIFRNALQPEQVLGVITCLFGVWLYQNKPAKQHRT